MADTNTAAQDENSPHDVDSHKSTYQTMMDVGFNAGLPIGGAVTLFVALVLMGTGPLVAFFLGFLAWLGLLGISKTFFSH